jgi:hypothetical protein
MHANRRHLPDETHRRVAGEGGWVIVHTYIPVKVVRLIG